MSQRGADIVLYTEVGGVRCNLDNKAFPSYLESTPVMPGPLTKLMPGTIVMSLGMWLASLYTKRGKALCLTECIHSAPSNILLQPLRTSRSSMEGAKPVIASYYTSISETSCMLMRRDV